MSRADRIKPRITAAAAVAGAIAVAGGTLAASWAGVAHATAVKPAVPHMTDMTGMHQTAYNFSTLDDHNDPTFNQLLGINNEGEIAGYFGSGAQGHPNTGYLLFPPFRQDNYWSENYPHSVQTQVTGLNDNGVTVGFFSTKNDANVGNDPNFGWYAADGHFHEVNFPTGTPAAPPVDQLLGVNDHDVAVGFFINGSGLNRGYTYNIKTKTFTRVLPPGASNSNLGRSLAATAINNNGDVAGSYTDSHGNTDGFLAVSHGSFRTLAFPGASSTQALGVNDHDEVVGFYMDGSGSSATTHGFTWTPGSGFATVDDPNGVGATTINGVNDAGDLVGFYQDQATGFFHGLLATPVRHTVTLHFNLTPMPKGKITLGEVNGQRFVHVSAYGLTPGSAHELEFTVFSPAISLVPVGVLNADSTGDVNATFPVASFPADGTSTIDITDAAASYVQIAVSPTVQGTGTYPLTAVENISPPSTPLSGQATITYDPGAQTLSVTVTAAGLTPGAHAAHIHVGSCRSQGGVQYMLMDFTADANGNITDQTRTLTGITSVMLNGGWYLNLHQGNSNDILSNGQPTILFRPLLCANI
jgi:CHRD domain